MSSSPHLLLVIALAAGCGGAATANPTAAPLDNGAGADDFLVWTEGDGDPGTTTWYDASGAVRGHADHIVLAAGATLWRLETVVSDVPFTQPCISGAGEDMVRELALIGPDGARIALGPAVLDDGRRHEREVRLRASLGRYLFVEDEQTPTTCDNDLGPVVNLAQVFDLATLAATSPLVTLEQVAHLREPALQVLRDELAHAGSHSPLEPYLAASLPSWRGGHLAMRHLIYVETCWDCSNGVWSSRTAGTWVDDAHVAPALAAEAKVPPAIAAVLAAAPAQVGVSWGQPDDRWRVVFMTP